MFDFNFVEMQFDNQEDQKENRKDHFRHKNQSRRKAKIVEKRIRK